MLIGLVEWTGVNCCAFSGASWPKLARLGMKLTNISNMHPQSASKRKSVLCVCLYYPTYPYLSHVVIVFAVHILQILQRTGLHRQLVQLQALLSIILLWVNPAVAPSLPPSFRGPGRSWCILVTGGRQIRDQIYMDKLITHTRTVSR